MENPFILDGVINSIDLNNDMDNQSTDTMNSTFFRIQAMQSNGAVDLTIPISPRSRYIDGCIRNGLNPRAALVLRKNLNRNISLQHHGIGDQRGVLLAETLSAGLPFVSLINIADNNLTDVSLTPILKAIISKFFVF